MQGTLIAWERRRERKEEEEEFGARDPLDLSGGVVGVGRGLLSVVIWGLTGVSNPRG